MCFLVTRDCTHLLAPNPPHTHHPLLCRSRQPPEDCTDEEELKEFEKSRKRPIRLRIVNFCNKWLQERPADFADDEEVFLFFFLFL